MRIEGALDCAQCRLAPFLPLSPISHLLQPPLKTPLNRPHTYGLAHTTPVSVSCQHQPVKGALSIQDCVFCQSEKPAKQTPSPFSVAYACTARRLFSQFPTSQRRLAIVVDDEWMRCYVPPAPASPPNSLLHLKPHSPARISSIEPPPGAVAGLLRRPRTSLQSMPCRCLRPVRPPPDRPEDIAVDHPQRTAGIILAPYLINLFPCNLPSAQWLSLLSVSLLWLQR